MRAHHVILLAALTCTGCTARNPPLPHPEDHPKRATLRVQLASLAARGGFAEMADKRGQRVYVSPVVELETADITEARALHSSKRSALVISLNRLGADRLLQVTRANVGACLAVFINDELICAPPIYGPDAGGRIQLFGVLSRDEAEKAAEALNRSEVP